MIKIKKQYQNDKVKEPKALVKNVAVKSKVTESAKPKN